MDKKILQFDFQSSTPCAMEVLDEMQPFWNERWANASSKQTVSSNSMAAIISLSKDKIANYLNLNNHRIIFTSGATEANNLGLLGYSRNQALHNNLYGNIITLSTEHAAVLDPLRHLQSEGFSLTELIPKNDGIIDLNEFASVIKQKTFLVSIMSANNEIGVIQPLEKISSICKERNILLHSDASQSLGFQSFDFYQKGAQMITISSHKIYGPKGIGALIIEDDIPLQPLFFGGGQEFGLRPGTPAIPLIVGFTKAIELAVKRENDFIQSIGLLRDKLKNNLLIKIPELIINGSIENRLPNNLNITIPNISGTQLHRYLRPLIACSSGSACSDGKPSHVLLSLGRSKEEAKSSLRLSLGKDTTEEEVDMAIKIISTAVESLR
tara:strand:+ start:12263 stop:13408 length:1146 start_codon:yes stop_codon:yes gene_type:complete